MHGTAESTSHQVGRPATDLSALFRLTDRLYRAQAEGEIFEAALDAIIETLSCKAASVLLFDNGVMRFRAWRGISAAYRKAVDGHSPWKPGDREAEPIFIEDIDHTGEPDWLKQSWLGKTGHPG